MKKLLFIIFTMFFIIGTAFANTENNILPSQLGIVQNVSYIDTESDIAQIRQVAEVKLLNGDLKNSTIFVDNMLTGNPYYDIKLKQGTKVILHVEENGTDITYSIEDIQRSNILIWLSLIFCGLLIYVGRKKGLYSFVSIILTCILIFKLLSPMILMGITPFIATIILCLLSTAITIYLVGGFNKKSSSAVLGCISSLIIAGILSLLTVKIANLNGFNNEHSMFLYTAHPELNFISLAVSAMVLATLGAVMDVAMSIASTINEIYTVDSSKNVKELFISGMNVGKDIIGTMANTLILVYLGTSLPLILLASNIDLQKFFNLNQVVTEISSALIGSCAIVICVPITAIIASNLIRKNIKELDNE